MSDSTHTTPEPLALFDYCETCKDYRPGGDGCYICDGSPFRIALSSLGSDELAPILSEVLCGIDLLRQAGQTRSAFDRLCTRLRFTPEQLRVLLDHLIQRRFAYENQTGLHLTVSGIRHVQALSEVQN